MASRSITRSIPKARKSVPLVVRVEGAKSVAVTGEFNRWSPEGVPLSQIHDGEWAVNLDLPPGEHQYRLIVDGEWRDDPSAKRHVPNPFGTENCVLKVD